MPIFVLRADNRGEGGTLAIMTLAAQVAGQWRWLALLLGAAGASLFFGDAVITPVISVLSAVEGLDVAAPAIAEWVVPITLGILIALFAVQRFGTARVSGVFGPVMIVWFGTLAALGIWHLTADFRVLAAFNPLHAATFIANHGNVAVAVLGAAFLAVTGAEALYVDLGHFGRKPILLAWFAIVLPCLILNYLGQGAFLLSHGGPVGKPLFEMVPPVLSIPMVVLATLATIIASQAVISGAYSMMQQAIQLNLMPRLAIEHTSEHQAGQIYIPSLNWLLLAVVIALTLGFRSSNAIASAYGISVTAEMLTTTLLLGIVMAWRWKWPIALAGAATLLFAAIDGTFLFANGAKFFEGGWVSILIAAIVFAVMQIWRYGVGRVQAGVRANEKRLEETLEELRRRPVDRVPGTGVYFTSNIGSTPTAMLDSLRHYHVLHEDCVVISIQTVEKPWLREDERLQIDEPEPWLRVVCVRFGFMEDQNLPSILLRCRKRGMEFDPVHTSYFVSRRTIVAGRKADLSHYALRIFVALTRLSLNASAFYRLPYNRVVELGTRMVV